MGGSLRSVKFVELLREFGWEATVIALNSVANKDNSEIFPNVLRYNSLTPYSRPYQITPYGWALKIWLEIKKSTVSNVFDLIYVTCPPFPQIISAILLKKYYSIPLVIDFRDAWLLNPYQKNDFVNYWLNKLFFTFVERWAISNCDYLILNTPSVLAAYQNKYPNLAARMTLLPNGFDERDFTFGSGYIEKSDHLNLLYCGSFGTGGRNPKKLLLAIQKFIKSGAKIRLTIVGDQPEIIVKNIETLGLPDNVQIKKEIEHSRAIKAMMQTDVLLLYQGESQSNTQAIAGKTYEYLRTGKPILSIAPPGDNQTIVKRYARRCELIYDYDVEKIYSALERFYKEWESDNLCSFYNVDEDYLLKFEHRTLTSKLSEIFNNVIIE